jgi:hypothetical protein
MTDDEARLALRAQLQRRVEQLFYRGLLDQMTANCHNAFAWLCDKPSVTAAECCVHTPRCPQ